MIPADCARDPCKRGRNLSSRIFRTFSWSPDISSRPPHFSIARAEPSRAFTDLFRSMTREFGRPVPFVDRVRRAFPRGHPARPTRQRISQASPRSRRDRRRTRRVDRSIDSCGAGDSSLGQPEQAPQPTHRSHRPGSRIASPVHSPAWRANRRSVTNLIFLSLTVPVVRASTPYNSASSRCSATS
jgi:hypothetical protein